MKLSERTKDQIAARQAIAAGLNVYKARLLSDDGCQYFCARSRYQAGKLAQKMPGILPHTVAAANEADLRSIAIRALEGL